MKARNASTYCSRSDRLLVWVIGGIFAGEEEGAVAGGTAVFAAGRRERLASEMQKAVSRRLFG
jgi:hypothetical protein